MPLFQTKIQIDHKDVARVLFEHWGLKLGKLIKASQNHTFEAFSTDENKRFSLRVTPDPKKECFQRISDQLTFVNYLIKNKINHLVASVPPHTQSQNKNFLVEGDLIFCVFEWAQGTHLDFMEFRWMRQKPIIYAWGKFFGEMHKLSFKFQVEEPEVAKRTQNWDKVHCSILAGIQLHPEDISVINDPQHFGVTHGDLNQSNFYFDEVNNCLSVFDTDQVQRAFFMFDLAQAMVLMPMLEQGGIPVLGTPVQGINTEEFIETMVEGYESTGLRADRARLDRMIGIKKQLYLRFAIRAFKEGNIPKDMEPFLKHILDKFGSKWKIEE